MFLQKMALPKTQRPRLVTVLHELVGWILELTSEISTSRRCTFEQRLEGRGLGELLVESVADTR